jgi:hypothetical protein
MFSLTMAGGFTSFGLVALFFAFTSNLVVAATLVLRERGREEEVGRQEGGKETRGERGPFVSLWINARTS